MSAKVEKWAKDRKNNMGNTFAKNISKCTSINRSIVCLNNLAIGRHFECMGIDENVGYM